MLYIDTDNKLKADEVQVVGADQVRPLVDQGWRILGVLGATMPGLAGYANLDWHSDGQRNNGSVEVPGPAVFTPQFIMGRDSEQKELVTRAEGAESHIRQLADQVAALSKQNENLQASADTASANVVTNAEAHDKRVRDLQEKSVGFKKDMKAQAADVRKVRREVGEARWRQILDAVDVEDALGE